VKLELDPTSSAKGNASLHLADPKSSYVWGLDLVRFAAALLVVFFHLSWKVEDPDVGFSAGWVGVEIFFVISGFVIMGSAGAANVQTFALKRFARLYPAATVCAIVNLAFLMPAADLANHYGFAVSATPKTFIASLLLIKGPFLVGALWTLPIEIGFYLLIGAMIPLGWVRRPTVIAAVLIGWSSIYLVPFCLSQYGILPFEVRPLGYGLLNLTMLRHGCFFGVGILFWMAYRRDAGTKQCVLLFLGIALCGVEIIARSAELQDLYGHSVTLASLVRDALLTFAVSLFGIWVFSRFNDRLRPGATTLAVMRILGLITYPLYLMHEGVGGVSFSLLRAAGHNQGLALLTGLAVSLAASWAVVKVFQPRLAPRLTALVQRVVIRILG
jgi:exopolysaccharide production protein ExoZ